VIHLNHRVEPAPEFDAPDLRPLEFHRRLPGYAPTPRVELLGLPGLSASTTVTLKDESKRFGLSAFKILGASWAAWRGLRASESVRSWTAGTICANSRDA